jgi:hypothetical protein
MERLRGASSVSWHEDVWNWRVGVHHDIGFAGLPREQVTTSSATARSA